MRKQCADARRNVYAYTIRENGIARFSDDGEPHGTAGLPTLDALRKRGIVDAAAVTTRYFGGRAAGTGGLVRAYSQAAAMAVEQAGVAEMATCAFSPFTVGYADYPRGALADRSPALRIERTAFGDGVSGVRLRAGGKRSPLPTDGPATRWAAVFRLPTAAGATPRCKEKAASADCLEKETASLKSDLCF